MNRVSLEHAGFASGYASNLAVFAAAAALAVTLIFNVWSSQLPRVVRTDQIIDQYGMYLSPARRQIVEIAKSDAGNVETMVRGWGVGRDGVCKQYKYQVFEFEAERNWFLTIDQHQRLWLYRGPWNRDWPDRRKMPSGGSIPYTPAVLMDGRWFDRRGQLFNGYIEVSTAATWSGIPQEFYDRIPDKNSPIWGHIPRMPAAPDRLTEQQADRLGLTQLWARAAPAFVP